MYLFLPLSIRLHVFLNTVLILNIYIQPILLKVLFSHYPEMDDVINTKLKSKLQVYFKNVPVEVEKTEKLAGFASGNILLPVAKGYA